MLAGEEHFFVTQATPIGGELGTRVQYSGYVWAAVLGGWRFLSRRELNRPAQGWWIRSPYSFVEQWVAG